jgi:enolase-phosphatase E1
MNVSAILTDIEGTTTDIDFVHKVLFPYAAEKLPAYVRAHAGDAALQPILAATRAEMNLPDADNEAVIDCLLGWIAADKKITPLKQLQGLIWEAGYRQGDFRGHLYADAYEGLKRWHAQGVPLYIFSSGSVRAQTLLFGHSDHGDLTPWFSGYFDTTTGAKRDAESYRRIAHAIGSPAQAVLFLSDITEELDAAAAAGMQVLQLVRGAAVDSRHPQVATFDEISIINRP